MSDARGSILPSPLGGEGGASAPGEGPTETARLTATHAVSSSSPHPPFGHPLPQGEREGAGGSSGGGAAPINRRHKEWRSALTPVLRQRARAMRAEPTEAERLLWTILRGRRFAGFKFRRQVPMGRYIVDFYCPKARLVIELDGSQHADNAGDVLRDRWLAENGYRVFRVWNNQLTGEGEAVADAIFQLLGEGVA